MEPHLRKGETIPAAVERVHGEIASPKADLHRIASAPIPVAEAKAVARQEIERLAEAGAPDVERVLYGGPIRWPMKDRPTHLPGPRVGDGSNDLALLAWLFQGPLLSRFEAEIDAIADDSAALSAEERRAEDERVRAEMLVLERVEEALIESAPSGVTIYRRQDADPCAVLGLADDLPGYQQD